jgi:proteic killer suppression protein
MIASFRHKGLRRLVEKGERQGVGAEMIARVEDVLSVLEAAESVEEANIPGFRLHELKGNRKGLWSVTVSGNWRIVFRFEDGAALDVDLVDYH